MAMRPHSDTHAHELNEDCSSSASGNSAQIYLLFVDCHSSQMILISYQNGLFQGIIPLLITCKCILLPGMTSNNGYVSLMSCNTNVRKTWSVDMNLESIKPNTYLRMAALTLRPHTHQI